MHPTPPRPAARESKPAGTARRWLRCLTLLPAVALMLASPLLAGGDCAGTSRGLVPLNDLGPSDLYHGYPGGLYPDGNLRPAAHEAAGLALAHTVQPLDALGNPDPAGLVGFVAVGMSNASHDADAFLALLQGNTAVSPYLRFANVARGGVDASDMADPAGTYWTVDLPARLRRAGLRAEQVQVVWLKQADAQPTGGFPSYALRLSDLLVRILNNLRFHFPNLKIAYLNSRAYAGYAASSLNPEPYAYEQGFAVKWVIERQIAGDPRLNHDLTTGAVRSPWLSWGVYMWADGLTPRSDGLVWDCSDFGPDGTHPSDLGDGKVARLLLRQFSSDPTATPWFLAAGRGHAGQQGYVGLHGHGTSGTSGVPGIAANAPATIPSAGPVSILTFRAAPNARVSLLFGLAPRSDGQVPLFGGSLLVAPLAARPATTDGAGNAAITTISIANNTAFAGLGLYWQWLVLDPVAKAGVALSPGLVMILGD